MCTAPRLCIALLFATSCIPTAARTNAKLEPGFDISMTGGGQLLGEGLDEDGRDTDLLITAHAEVGAQGAWAFDNGSAFAVQLKAPAIYVFTSVDLYYQLPRQSGRLYTGVGAELGAAPALYAVFSLIDDGLYVTFTPRVLLQGLNPQVAVGYESDAVDISVFLGYLRFFGDGLDIDIDLTSSNNADEDRRLNAFLVGASARF